jgi:hypothetical protein
VDNQSRHIGRRHSYSVPPSRRRLSESRKEINLGIRIILKERSFFTLASSAFIEEYEIITTELTKGKK